MNVTERNVRCHPAQYLHKEVIHAGHVDNGCAGNICDLGRQRADPEQDGNCKCSLDEPQTTARSPCYPIHHSLGCLGVRIAACLCCIQSGNEGRDSIVV